MKKQKPVNRIAMPTTSQISEPRITCPDHIDESCHKIGCPRYLVRIRKERIDDDGNLRYSGMCILNGDTESFHDLLPDTSPIQETRPTGKPKSTARRRTFASAYAGKKYKSFQIAEDASSITINKRVFQLSRQADATIVDHAFRYAMDAQDGFTIPFSSTDYNSLSKGCREFVNIWIEREIRKGMGNKKYTGYARFKIENLN